MSIVFDMSNYQPEIATAEHVDLTNFQEGLELHTQLQLVEESPREQTSITTQIYAEGISQFLSRM